MISQVLFSFDLVKMVANISKVNPLIPVASTSPVIEAVRLLTEHHAHRVVIVEPTPDGSNRFAGILSQSLVCAYVASKLGYVCSFYDIFIG